ncbi:MAG: Ycf66 family protein [Microcystis sp. M015S2]|uniref:Ycf66 family protein n=1 Tax=unclassified Microcystis TaxID=2643300 RepID=UPI00258D15E4|nr:MULTISPECIES: Ycf66 family protein [unclassified Microcystis]MCA2710704.1 Ycf66 family protein [Microcystis sp. M025S2]MCA2744870.1 Ycf66 family protein [Microcystis sp. M015S2]MCA2760310.1 Ycf66 family protein [Microcystis sp. M145S2]
MLPYILAVVVGLSSLYLLTTAFIAPDRHRQDDFLWSAVGLFYALVLWLCAGRITGAILLGQVAAAILFIAFAWQTLKLRQALFYPDKPVKLFTIVGWLGNRLGKVTPSQSPKTKAKAEKVAAKVKETVKETVDPVIEKAAAIGETITESVTEIAEKAQETVDPVIEKAAAIGETITESVTEIGEKAAEIIDDGETFDDFDDFDDFDLATEEINPAEIPPEIPPTEPVANVEVETIAVSETVIIEVTEENLPSEETIGEDTAPETRSQSAENPPSSD